MEPIVVKYGLTEQDLIQFNRWVSFRKTKIFPNFFIFFVIVAMAGLVLYMAEIIDLFILVLLVFPLFLLFGFVPLIQRLSVKTMYKKNGLIKQEYEHIINEEGILQQNKKSKLKIKWAQVLFASESSYGIYLFITSNQGLILPKRVFSDSEIERLRSLILEKLPSAKTKRMNKKI